MQINRARTCVYQLFVVSLHAQFVNISKINMYKFLKQLFLPALLGIAFSGCVTQKSLTYLQDADPSTMSAVNDQFAAQTELTIRPGDALTIFVSALDQEAVAPFNLPTVTFATPGSTNVQTTPMLQYYVVDEAGDINFPILGKLHLAGMKRPEAEAYIKSRLEQQVMNPLVQLEFVGAKISVLGEVNRPGKVLMPRGRMTILDAIAEAGDLTPYGKRNNILVTREVDGKLEVARIDMRSKDIYTSPYYYLQQNDVIYVSPNKVRAVNSATTGLWLSIISTALSATTVIVTVLK